MRITLNSLNLKRSWLIGALALSLSGCPDPAPAPVGTEVDMSEEDAEGFKYDLDLPDMEMMEDMEPPEPDAEVMLDLTCSPCESDSDCGEGFSCVTFDDEGDEKLCFKPCADEDEGDDRCGEGSSCLTLDDDTEICVSDDSDGECELCYDLDGDGYGPGGFCPDGDQDCAPEDPDVSPGRRSDTCDGVDADCDGEVDEDFIPTECGSGSCVTESACVDGEEVACVEPEIRDDDATCDGLDDDCDGSVDEDYVSTECGEGVCVAASACDAGVEALCTPLDPSAADDTTCNGVDEDCDGRIDETFIESCGLGVCVRSAACTGGVTSCEPRAPEVGELDSLCDNIDQDCDGAVDEGFTTTQNCGEGVCQVTGSCVAGDYVCEPLEPSAIDDTTCDGIDEDCDGEIDEDCQTNTLRVEYNASASSADRVALDIIYDQEVSPVRVPENYQPTLAYIAITFPQGLSSNRPFSAGGSYDLGQSTIDSGKSVSVTVPPDEPNTRRYQILGILGDAADSFLRPSALVDGANPARSGHILTLYFDTNGVAAPWSFSWSVGYTQFAPEAAMEVLELSEILPISP